MWLSLCNWKNIVSPIFLSTQWSHQPSVGDAKTGAESFDKELVTWRRRLP
jgi:hypothetical protein